jgi:hypothetical protein
MPVVGEVVGFVTSNVLAKDKAYKFHLCVGDRTHQYLLVNSRQFPDDFPLTNLECDGLELDESYVSVSRVLFVPTVPKGARWICKVSPAYLSGLYAHAASSGVASVVDQMKILNGLAAHLPS